MSKLPYRHPPRHHGAEHGHRGEQHLVSEAEAVQSGGIDHDAEHGGDPAKVAKAVTDGDDGASNVIIVARDLRAGVKKSPNAEREP